MKRITGVNGTLFYDCVSFTKDFLAEHKSFDEIGMVEAEIEIDALRTTGNIFVRSPRGISVWTDLSKWKIQRL